jgi:hypothetical protein
VVKVDRREKADAIGFTNQPIRAVASEIAWYVPMG